MILQTICALSWPILWQPTTAPVYFAFFESFSIRIMYCLLQMNYITMTKNPSTAFRSNAIIYDKFSTSLNPAFDETLPDEFGFGLVNKTQICIPVEISS